MEALITPTDYDKAAIDYRKHHVRMGPGDGRDLIYSEGKFFTAFGAQIEPTKAALSENGIPFTEEIVTFVQKHNLRRQEKRLREKLEAQIKAIEDREKLRINERLSNPNSVTANFIEDEEDLEDVIENIDLSGMDDLMNEAENPDLDMPNPFASQKVEEEDLELEVPEAAKPKAKAPVKKKVTAKRRK